VSGISDKLETQHRTSLAMHLSLTCCFPKGSVAFSLLETQMAVL
jgi:hypothetical protein